MNAKTQAEKGGARASVTEGMEPAKKAEERAVVGWDDIKRK